MTQTDDNGFPSGPWTGYYLYSDPQDLHRMDLDLHFANGAVSGAGADDVGAFSIRGSYESETQKVWWRKSYLGSHTVAYSGVLDGRRIWGTWELRDGLSARGGFKIWPKQAGEASETRAAEAIEATDEVFVRIRPRRQGPPAQQ